MKHVRYVLSLFFYYLGDGVSRLTIRSSKYPPIENFLDFLGFYRMYQVFMRWSFELDTEYTVWTKFDPDREKK